MESKKKSYEVIVAIDFGTHGTGVAFRIMSDEDSEESNSATIYDQQVNPTAKNSPENFFQSSSELARNVKGYENFDINSARSKGKSCGLWQSSTNNVSSSESKSWQVIKIVQEKIQKRRL